jgi:hypothetical protein
MRRYAIETLIENGTVPSTRRMQKATSFWVVEDDVKLASVCFVAIFSHCLFVVCRLWPTFAFIFDGYYGLLHFVLDACFVV